MSTELNENSEQQYTTRGEIGKAVIKVVGVGGGGCNAVARMHKNRIPGIDYIVANTDKQALDNSGVPTIVRVGDETARGLGVGGDPSRGRACMEEDRDKMRRTLEGADMVFIAAGMGGGTGTGGAPTAAAIARETGALTIGVVTKPFSFEGFKRQQQAELGIEELRKHVDTLIVIPNDRLSEMNDTNLTIEAAFDLADNVLKQGVQAIAELILVTGEINLDFADVRAIMDKAGPAWMAIGRGAGQDRAIKAAEDAMRSPLLEVDIQGARGVMFNVTGGSDLTLDEVQSAADVISEMVHPDANIIFGTVTDPSLRDEIKLTIIATGFEPAGDSQYNMPSVQDQIDDIVDIKDLEAVNVPPFLRNHPAARRKLLKLRQEQEQETTSN